MKKRKAMPPPEKVVEALSLGAKGIDYSGRRHRFELDLEKEELVPPEDIETWGAIYEADFRNDKQPVVDLLRSGLELSRRHHLMIADWLDRHVVTRRRGKQRTPSHEYSLADSALVYADEGIRELMKRGMAEGDAVKRVAEKTGIDEKTLKNFRDDRRGSSRRQDKRP